MSDGINDCSSDEYRYKSESHPPAESQPSLKRGFLVCIECHTQEAIDAITSPEALRFMVGHMIDSWKLQEEIDYTLEVSRTYEQQAAERELKNSETIRHAEKKILIQEIEAHTNTKAELARVREALQRIADLGDAIFDEGRGMGCGATVAKIAKAALQPQVELPAKGEKNG